MHKYLDTNSNNPSYNQYLVRDVKRRTNLFRLMVIACFQLENFNDGTLPLRDISPKL